MPNRILREGILSSEAVCGLGWAAEVFYRRLMSVADDHGRFYAMPKLLRAACYPLQIDKVSDADIGKWISECETAALVSVYPASDGKRYLQIKKFGQQVRSKSKYPEPIAIEDMPPPASASGCSQLLADAHLGESVFGVVSEGVGDTRGKRAKPAPKVSMPEGFGVSAAVGSWATEKGYDRLDEHMDAFKRKCKAKSYVYADWDSAFMEAVREDWAKLRGSSPRGAAPPPESVKSADADRSAAYLREQAEHAANAVPPPPNLRALVRKLTSTAA